MESEPVNPEKPPVPVEADPSALCPSCERPIGPRTRCPFCGAAIHARISLQVFRWGAVALAVLGLFFLYFWARNREITRVRIGAIVETMNMAYVRVEGTVGRTSLEMDEQGRARRLDFDLDDGTGVARIKADRNVARALAARDLIPRRGDRATLAGSIRVNPEGVVILFLQTADHLELTPSTVMKVRLGELDSSYVGRIVLVEGRVGSIFAPGAGSKAPYKVLLRDENRSAFLVVWQGMWGAIVRAGLKSGASVVVRVTVGEHRGKLQLLIDDPRDLSVESGPIPPPSEEEKEALSPARVTRALLGRTVRVRGTVAHVTRLRLGVKITLEEGETALEVYALNAVAEDVEDLSRLGKGALVRVRGKVVEYKGRIQVSLRDPKQFEIEEAGPEAPPPFAAPKKRSAASLTRDDKDKIVILTGRLASVHSIEKGTKAFLEDGSGKAVAVIVWDTVRKKMRNPDILRAGCSVQVIGRVMLFRGELQVVPEEGWDVIGKE